MKSKFLQLCLISGLLSFGSCVGDDIDDLQDQIDDLTEQVELVEAAQKADLEAQIAALMAEITALQTANVDQDADYADLLAQLEATQDEVAANAAAVYYGNVISDDEYAAYVASGASIVTGRISVTSQSNADDLALLETVGGSLSISGGTTVSLPLLKTVASDILIEGMDATDASVDMPMLSIAGDNFYIKANPGLISAKTEALTFIAGNLDINAVLEDYASLIAELELGGVDVLGNVYVSGINGGDLELGQIGGNFELFRNVISNLVVTSTTVGDFSIEYTAGDFVSVEFENLTTVEGDFNFSKNKWDTNGNGTAEGITSLDGAFAALTTVGKNFTVENNKMILTLDDFNNVTTIGGKLGKYETAYVTIKTGGEVVNVLNGLVTVAGNKQVIVFHGEADFITGFQSLTTPDANKMSIETVIGVNAEFSEGGGGVGPMDFGTKEVVFNAFDAVTMVYDLKINMTKVCEQESYTDATGGKATITAFTALTTIGNFFELDFSAQDSEINFTGLNALTTIKPYNFNDKYFSMKFNVGNQGLTANINAFESLNDIKIMVIEHTARGGSDLTELNFTHGLPTLASGAKFKYTCLNVYGTSQYPRAVSEGALYTLLTEAFVSKTSEATVYLQNRYGVLVDDPALTDDDYDKHYNAIFDNL